MEKRNIAIIFGGCSPEYSVSLSSAYSVICNLNREKYNALLIGITKEGDWFYYTGSPEKIQQDTWHNEADCVPALLSPNRTSHSLLLLREGKTEFLPVDAVFPILHGKNGEDGTLQGLTELAGIPLVGCGTLSSALCMDKDRAHRLAGAAGVRVPQAVVLEADAGLPHSTELSAASVPSDPKELLSTSLPHNREELFNAAKSFADTVGYPLFVKPVKAGSSFGVTKVETPDNLSGAIALAFQYDDQVIVEEGIEGFEVGCAVLGTHTLTVGCVDEIELSEGFFDFTEKYTLKTSSIHVPARISAQKAEEVRETAKTIYRALGCSGFARVDMFLTPDGEIVFNEVNTIPGFTEHSRYPGMMKAAGITFPQILEELIDSTI